MATGNFRQTSGSGGSFIGAELTIEGEITGSEDLRVAGRVKGGIQVKGNVAVESGAVVEADVEAGEVLVNGTLNGNVRATERIEIASDGRLVGDVTTQRLQIADGAAFKGSVDMEV